MKLLDKVVENDPVLREMRSFRAVRWIIFLFLGVVFWVLDGYATYKGWLAMTFVLFFVIYFEIAVIKDPQRAQKKSESDT